MSMMKHENFNDDEHDPWGMENNSEMYMMSYRYKFSLHNVSLCSQEPILQLGKNSDSLQKPPNYIYKNNIKIGWKYSTPFFNK